jgi:integrase
MRPEDRIKPMPKHKKPSFGRIFQKFNRDENGNKVYHSTWTVRFKGRDYSTGTDNYALAERKLKELISDSIDEKSKTAKRAIEGESVLTVADLLKLVEQDYIRERKANLATVRGQIKNHLVPTLGSMRAIDVTGAAITKYKDSRLAEEAAAASINRELSVLLRGYRIAAGEGTISRIPPIKKLKEDNVRTGFVNSEQYRALYDELPDCLKPVVCVAYHIGDRKGELLNMMIDQVDLEHLEIRLEPGTTKNDRGRTAPIYGEMRTILSEHIAKAKEEYPACRYLFHDHGEPIQSFRKSWASACKRAGLEGLLFHDLRRSAVRNLTRAGVPRPVAMQITGHRTESVYRRYDIVDSQDLAIARKLLEDYSSKSSGGEKEGK